MQASLSKELFGEGLNIRLNVSCKVMRDLEFDQGNTNTKPVNDNRNAICNGISNSA
jgi:hypothetical protein